jgi:hypothetical protein
MEALAKKYRGRARFVFVYTQEHHANRAFLPPPQMGLQPIPTLDRTADRFERTQRARDFRTLMHGRVRPILVDEDDEEGFTRVQNAYDARYAARLVVVDQHGMIALDKIEGMGAESAVVEECLRKLLGDPLASPETQQAAQGQVAVGDG